MIAAQQDRNRERWPAGIPVLFPRPHSNIDGTRPLSTSSYRSALRSWLERCDIRDEYGQPVRITPHQWRHTLGTTLKVSGVASAASFGGLRERRGPGLRGQRGAVGSGGRAGRHAG
jgi:integrase